MSADPITQNPKVGEKVRANKKLPGSLTLPNGVGTITEIDGLGTSNIRIKVMFGSEETVWVEPEGFERAE